MDRASRNSKAMPSISRGSPALRPVHRLASESCRCPNGIFGLWLCMSIEGQIGPRAQLAIAIDIVLTCPELVGMLGGKGLARAHALALYCLGELPCDQEDTDRECGPREGFSHGGFPQYFFVIIRVIACRMRPLGFLISRLAGIFAPPRRHHREIVSILQGH